MSTLWGSKVVFPALCTGRVLLALVGLPESIRQNHLLASPLSSYASLQEGIYLFDHGIDPYSGGVFRHSPLYLSLFTTIIPYSIHFAALLWAFCDILAAWAMIQTWRVRQRVESSTRDGLVAASYLLNPYILLPSLALSTSSIENLVVLSCLMFASQGKKRAALLSLAVSVHLSISTTIVVVPVILLLAADPVSRLASPQSYTGSLRRTFSFTLELFVYFSLLTLASTIVAGGFNWIPQTWGSSLTLPDLTPNPGMWWYFFTEMFDHFRPFFLMVFSVHLMIYVAPICLKFQHDPLYATFLLLGIVGTFKAYPTLADPGIFLSMISMFPEIYPYLRHPIVTVLLHLHAFLLMPLFHHIWLSQGTGNANFFYASTLVFGCANGAAVVDCMWAGLRIAIGDAKDDKWAVAQE